MLLNLNFIFLNSHSAGGFQYFLPLPAGMIQFDEPIFAPPGCFKPPPSDRHGLFFLRKTAVNAFFLSKNPQV